MKKSLTLLAICLLITSLLVACSPAATPAPAPPPAPATPAKPAPTTTTAAPAPAPSASPAATPKPTTSPSPSLSPTAAPPAGSAADFFKNNVVTLVVPYAAGGGTDIGARTFAAWWPEATGGAMIVKNVVGGAAVVGANDVYKAKTDGTTLGFTIWSAGLLLKALMGESGVQFDLSKYSWIGGLMGQPYALSISVKSPVSTIADLQKTTGFKFGVSSPSAQHTLGVSVVIDAFGLTNPRVISGLVATPETGLALGKGEIDGTVYDGGGTNDFITKGFSKPKPLLQVTSVRNKEWFPDIPAIPELAKLSPDQEKRLKLFEAISNQYAVFGPPGLPADRLQYLRQAFDKVVAIKGFQDQAKFRYPAINPPVSGKDWEAFVQNTLKTVPRADVDALFKIATQYMPK